MHTKYKVVEYFGKPRVFICSDCCGIGHFRKNCPEGDEATCKTCGDKCSDALKCAVVNDYHAPSTRNLFTNIVAKYPQNMNTDAIQLNNVIPRPPSHRLPYSVLAGTLTPDTNDQISKKLDTILTKI